MDHEQKQNLSISKYQPARKSCELLGRTVEQLRQFESQKNSYSLIVDPQTLQTEVVETSCLQCNMENQTHSKYQKLLEESHAPPNPFHNDGLVRLNSPHYILTADLCPSSKRLEYSLFEKLKTLKTSFPIGLAISGGWIQRHGQELHWLLQEEQSGYFQFVWINHSYSHPYDKGQSNQDNFLRKPRVDLVKEVLGQEQIMIRAGLTPSIYFRFPGLISDAHLMQKLKDWGLVVLGSNAWVGKNQFPKPGSIVLLHANGNEHSGVRLFLSWLDHFSIHGDDFSSLWPSYD